MGINWFHQENRISCILFQSFFLILDVKKLPDITVKSNSQFTYMRFVFAVKFSFTFVFYVFANSISNWIQFLLISRDKNQFESNNKNWKFQRKQYKKDEQIACIIVFRSFLFNIKEYYPRASEYHSSANQS